MSATPRRARRSHANRGKALEGRLDAMHQTYAAQNRAFIWRSCPPVKVLSAIRAGGYFSACFAGQGPADYAGVIAGGRAVVIEAKECSAGRWSLANLHPHQAEHLERVHVLGGVAQVVLAYAPTRSTWALPWEGLGPRWRRWKRGEAARGEASLGPVELVEVGVRLEGVDWLVAISTQLRNRGPECCPLPGHRGNV